MQRASGPDLVALTPWQRAIDRLLAARDRLLASPVFRRRAAAFAPTRAVAQRRASELFDLVAGFVYSQVLYACVRLGLFDLLSARPWTVGELAIRLEMPLAAAQRLLDAAVSLRLVERRSGLRYGLGELGAPMVGNSALAAMVLHHATFYRDLADPVGLLRATPAERADSGLARYWAYEATQATAENDRRVADYSQLMTATQPLVADEILDAYPLAGHRCLLDVGGGEGGFLEAAARRAPALGLMLFDLPAVAERARERLRAGPLAQRVQVHGGSFLVDALPTGADIVSLVRVIHDHDDAAVMTLLRAVRAALAPGGTLLLAEPVAGTPGAAAMGDAYFGFYLLAMGQGRPRTLTTLMAMVRAAGFDAVQPRRTRQPLQTSLLVARAGSRKP